MKNIQKKILVTGSNGQLATEFKYLKKKIQFKLIFSDKKKIDISKLTHLINFLKINPVDIIINCASYNKVDKAENKKNSAYNVNKKGVNNLINISKKIKIYHLSI